LAGYSLLLEHEFSRKVDSGIIEIMGKEEHIILDENLKNKVLEIAEKIRNLHEENAFTPNNFSKCKNCEFREDCDN
jgi:CRISPR/Cas system-associated exonuclease Cas4 (RecB family)